MDSLPVLAIERSNGVLAPLSETADRARRYFDAAQSANTRRVYASDIRHFDGWCHRRGFAAFPAEPQTVALYLADYASKLSVATLGRRLAAISTAHKLRQLESPLGHAAIRTVWQGIRREHGVAPNAKAPALTADLRAMVDGLSDRTIDVRDRALLLLGFAGALRRSELVGLDVGDVMVTVDGLTVTLQRSKTDQEGEGQKIGLPYGGTPATCPVRAYQAWVVAASITEGAIFRPINRHGRISDDRLSGAAVAEIVKRRVEAAGLDPSRYAGHSLRAGLATSAAAAGVSERSIMAQTRHKSLPMVRRYIREGSLFRENAAAKVGL